MSVIRETQCFICATEKTSVDLLICNPHELVQYIYHKASCWNYISWSSVNLATPIPPIKSREKSP